MKVGKLLLLTALLLGIFFASNKFASSVFAQTSGVTLGPWRETAAFVSGASRVSHPLPSFARGNFYYVHTMVAESGDDRKLYFAGQNQDGSLTAWQVASDDHGGGPQGYTAITVDGVPYHFRNGHIARYEFNTDGTMNGDVRLQESNIRSSFGGHLWFWDSAVFAPLQSQKYVFHFGGFDCAARGQPDCPYDYRNDIFRSSVPIGSSFQDTNINHPATRPGKAAFFKPQDANYGFIYTTASGGNILWKALVSANGNLGNWQEVGSLPTGSGNQRGEMFVIDNTLFVIRGAKVFKAMTEPELGNLTSWDDSPPDLPEDQIDMWWGGGHLEGASYGIIGNYVYVTGPKKVYYAQIGGSADPTATPTTSPNTHPCLSQARAGDYDCSGAINAGDFDKWKSDFTSGISYTTLSFFEYWRRVSY